MKYSQSFSSDLNDLIIKSYHRSVLEVLGSFANNKTRIAFPGVQRIAWILGKTERRVQVALRELERDSLIQPIGKTNGGRGNTVVYQITLENGNHKGLFEHRSSNSKSVKFSTFSSMIKGDVGDMIGDMIKGDAGDIKGDAGDIKGDVGSNFAPANPFAVNSYKPHELYKNYIHELDISHGSSAAMLTEAPKIAPEQLPFPASPEGGASASPQHAASPPNVPKREEKSPPKREESDSSNRPEKKPKAARQPEVVYELFKRKYLEARGVPFLSRGKADHIQIAIMKKKMIAEGFELTDERLELALNNYFATEWVKTPTPAHFATNFSTFFSNKSSVKPKSVALDAQVGATREITDEGVKKLDEMYGTGFLSAEEMAIELAAYESQLAEEAISRQSINSFCDPRSFAMNPT